MVTEEDYVLMKIRVETIIGKKLTDIEYKVMKEEYNKFEKSGFNINYKVDMNE